MEISIDPPINEDFNLDSIKELALQNKAVSFFDKQPVDYSDSGLLLNPNGSSVQFAVATYKLDNGLSMTHSIAAYMPAIARKAYEAAITSGRTSAIDKPSVHYNNVIDITLPYYVPHALIFPKLTEGFLASIFAADAPVYSKKQAIRVKLEGDFSEFIDAYVAVGDDVNTFVYLAPDIMEIVLEKMTEFTIEFIDNHVYLYYRPKKAKMYMLGPKCNTNLNMDIHKMMLSVGLSMGVKLSNASRPLKQSKKEPYRFGMPPPAFFYRAGLVILIPFALFFIVPFFSFFAVFFDDTSQSLFDSMIAMSMTYITPLLSFVIISAFRYLRQKRRAKKYNMRYTSN